MQWTWLPKQQRLLRGSNTPTRAIYRLTAWLTKCWLSSRHNKMNFLCNWDAKWDLYNCLAIITPDVMLFSADLHNSSIAPALESNVLGVRDPVLYFWGEKTNTTVFRKSPRFCNRFYLRWNMLHGSLLQLKPRISYVDYHTASFPSRAKTSDKSIITCRVSQTTPKKCFHTRSVCCTSIVTNKTVLIWQVDTICK